MISLKAVGAVLLLVNICFAFHPYVNMESDEINSNEHGQKAGSKQTTCRCGWANKGFNRIVGGVETKVNEYPFVVAVGNQRPTSIFCGGTIVSPKHVMTAAHCTFDKIANTLMVIVGEHSLVSSTETKATDVINVRSQVLHPAYDSNTEVNDIALLYLTRTIQFNDQVGPACLPTGDINLVHQYIKVMGWGHTRTNGSHSMVLRKVNLRVIPLIYCARSFRTPISTTNPTQYCTFSKGKDSCQGDSGGPNVWLDPETNRYTLVGVVSFGADCASYVPGVNTDVTKYLPWIKRSMAATDATVSSCTKK